MTSPLIGSHLGGGRSPFTRRQRQPSLRAQQASSSAFFSSSMGYHANLRKHLPEQAPVMAPSPLKRQNAFLQEDRPNTMAASDFSIPHPNVDDAPSPAPSQHSETDEDPKCRICFGESEEGGATFIVPCKCNGTIRYVHDICLKDWMSSRTLPRRCSTCMEPFSFYPPPGLASSNPVHSRRPILRTVLIIALTTFVMESYRCTELQKIPGSELDDEDPAATAGRPDYIWLPIVQHKCWREGLLATVFRYTFRSPVILCIAALLLFYRISVLLKAFR